MFLYDIQERYQQAHEENYSFLLVCIDVWDAQKQDKDLGYYYRVFREKHDVIGALKDYYLGPFSGRPDDTMNCCEAVIEITGKEPPQSKSECLPSADWLALNAS